MDITTAIPVAVLAFGAAVQAARFIPAIARVEQEVKEKLAALEDKKPQDIMVATPPKPKAP